MCCLLTTRIVVMLIYFYDLEGSIVGASFLIGNFEMREDSVLVKLLKS